MPTVLYSEDTGLGAGDPVVALPGTGLSVPTGLESTFNYGGLTMNDLTVVDKFRITKISGIDDPDIRDSREENPGYHGETAFEALYGGRTLVLEGTIECYTVNKLRDMTQALRTAFVDLTEKPLYFLTGDPNLNHYINCRKSAKINIEEEQTDVDKFFRDFQVTLRASDPRFYKTKTKSYSLNIYDDAPTSAQVSVVNNGNFETHPIVTVQGAVTDFVMSNDNSLNALGEEEEFRLLTDFSIADDDFYRIDMKNRTIIDSDGVNQINDLDITSDWLRPMKMLSSSLLTMFLAIQATRT
jgi:phage-related protein